MGKQTTTRKSSAPIKQQGFAQWLDEINGVICVARHKRQTRR